MTVTRHEYENESIDEFSPQERQILRATLKSPRLNEVYDRLPGNPSRWRLMQATVLIFALVVAYSFWLTNEALDRIDRASVERRDDACAAVTEAFNGVIRLVDALTEPVGANGEPRPLTPEQLDQQRAIRNQAREILVSTKACTK